jgi:hypothetical protein
LPSAQVSAVSDVPTGSSSRSPTPKSVLWALRRFLLIRGSNTIRTCVQGFTALRGAGKPLTCDDGDLRVQEHRSAAERGSTRRAGIRRLTHPENPEARLGQLERLRGSTIRRSSARQLGVARRWARWQDSWYLPEPNLLTDAAQTTSGADGDGQGFAAADQHDEAFGPGDRVAAVLATGVDRSCSVSTPKCPTIRAAVRGPIPLINPELRYVRLRRAQGAHRADPDKIRRPRPGGPSSSAEQRPRDQRVEPGALRRADGRQSALPTGRRDLPMIVSC